MKVFLYCFHINRKKKPLNSKNKNFFFMFFEKIVEIFNFERKTNSFQDSCVVLRT